MAVIIISIERLEFTWSPMSEMTLLVGSMLLVANKGELMLMRCSDMVLENNEARSTNATKTTESMERKDRDTNFPTHQLPFSGFIKSTN